MYRIDNDAVNMLDVICCFLTGSGKLADFCDHYVPASINLAGFLQTLVQSGNTKRFLNSMQSEYDKIEARNFR